MSLDNTPRTIYDHIWSLMEKRASSSKSPHIYIGDRTLILDAIARAMGEPRTGIETNRSQIIVKAVNNFIDDCRKKKNLRIAIERAESLLRVQNAKKSTQTTRTRGGLEVVS